MLDRLAGLADQKHSCGYEDAVLRGPRARVSDNHAAPLSACCASLESAKAALDAVSEVIWSITPNWSIPGIAAEPGGENATLVEPYTMDPACIVRWMAWRGQLSPSSDSAKYVLVCLTWVV